MRILPRVAVTGTFGVRHRGGCYETMKVDLHDITVSQEADGAVGSVMVEVRTETEAAALAALSDVTEAVESVETESDLPLTWERDDDPTDGTADGESESESDGESDPPGAGVPYDDSEAEVRERVDGIIEVETPNGYTAVLHAGSRTYQVLYHMAHYWYSDGGGSFTTAELDERYDHLDYTSVGPCISTLRRAGLIDPLERIDGGGHRYRLTDDGEEYVHELGEPTSYRLPE